MVEKYSLYTRLTNRKNGFKEKCITMAQSKKNAIRAVLKSQNFQLTEYALLIILSVKLISSLYL